MTSERIHLVTAVSRQENLPRIHRSIEAALAKSKLKARWILVIDDPGAIWSSTESAIRAGSIEIEKVVYTGGKHAYGIPQKNLGIDQIKDGYFHLMDDDNLVHPEFFVGLERAMATNLGPRAFVFGQQRWDGVGNLSADPERMHYGKIDNTMFATHIDIIGANRYDLEKAGSEDYHFFKNLWDANFDKFVFVRETLAYYNYLKHHPVESPWEPLRQAIVQASPAQTPSPMVVQQRTPGMMKIAMYSSKRDRCGISTYTEHLAAALRLLGHEVEYFSSMQFPYGPEFEKALRWQPDVFHFQHETSIMPPASDIERYSGLLRNGGAKTFVTLHTESPENIRIGRSAGGKIILHRPAQLAPDAYIIPMPCTTVSTLPEKQAARRHFGIPHDAFLISTVGFMIPWKDHPKILERLAPWIRSHPDVHIQLIASAHFNEDLQSYAHLCRQQIQAVAAGNAISDRVHHVDSYPNDIELINRLSMSDLGYVWCPFDTGSCSAAGAQFTTAKCPLVATNSSHYSTLGDGAVFANKEDMSAFVELIKKMAGDPGTLDRMRSNQDGVYAARNYLETAKRHLAIYKGEI